MSQTGHICEMEITKTKKVNCETFGQV
uniref:Uncharacterized protein n=1 Tax=Rhizophora mucronata TaxID=61149 RepID=A0A2P2N6N5_RHIMU